jgi:Fe-Mn family superoxide dismutase
MSPGGGSAPLRGGRRSRQELNQLRIIKTHNQETPFARGFCPLFCIDVWEHAYYLKHYNDRAGYIDDWFAVLNMDFANKNFESSLF